VPERTDLLLFLLPFLSFQGNAGIFYGEILMKQNSVLYRFSGFIKIFLS